MVLSKKELLLDVENLLINRPEVDKKNINEALLLCENKEKALFIASQIIDSGLEEKTIVASILLDVDTAKVDSFFGAEISQLVTRTKQLEKIYIPEHIKKDYEKEVVTMLVAFAEDVRVLFLTIAYTLYLLKFQKSYFSQKEVKNILRFMPYLASRLNLWKFKMQIEDTCFKILEPDAYFSIEKKLAKINGQRNDYMQNCLKILKNEFQKHKLKIETSGRIKHSYSIYKKIKLKKLKFEEIYDLIAIRVVVESVDECYQGLGIVHHLWQPEIEKIKDYIAVPKPNNYKSLHTTVTGPKGQLIEVQIRTKQMDHEANFGIAAHWAYSQKKRSIVTEEEQSRWITSLLNLHQSPQNAKLDDMKIDFYKNNIFVFTEEGEVVRLEKGATVQDLAFAINKNNANCLQMCEINNVASRFSAELNNCDLVNFSTRKSC